MQNTLRLVTLLAWGLWIPAYAQAPTFSLPPIPGAGGASSAPAPASAPQNPSSNISAPPSLPGLETIVGSEQKKAEETQEAKQEEAAPKDAGIKPLPETVVSTGATNDPTNPMGPTGPIPYNVAPPPLTLDRPAPDNRNATAAPPPLPALGLPAPPPAIGLAATAIPEPKAEPEKKAVPTWKEVLKPSYKPVETTFNFRRQVLPPTIYRQSYSPANRHLPTARYAQTYDHAFLLAAARNDVNAVRAMLDSGRRNVNLMNAEGDSVLIVAVRHGAFATARLLIARGADPMMPGASGWSAYDYAQYWGNPELLAAIYNGRLG